MNVATLSPLLACPRCRSGIALAELRCENESCRYAREPFPASRGQPVLIDFENSIFSRSDYEGDKWSVIERDDTGQGLKTRLRLFITGQNKVAAEKSSEMLRRLRKAAPRPRVLIVGGGAIGSGLEGFYGADGVEIVGTDVYASDNTVIVCDGHRLPFVDESFDSVWIQSVLQYVLDPSAVAGEIHRVLKPGGLVYADSPFMQQIAEGGFDFTRFTQSGHRWLFRRFEEIDAGYVGNPGSVLIWSIQYFVRSFGVGDKAARLASLPFFWLRFLERPSKRPLIRFPAD